MASFSVAISNYFQTNGNKDIIKKSNFKPIASTYISL